MKIVEEEADETLYWLELITEADLLQPATVQPLTKEINEILAMTVASIKTVRRKTSSMV